MQKYKTAKLQFRKKDCIGFFVSREVFALFWESLAMGLHTKNGMIHKKLVTFAHQVKNVILIIMQLSWRQEIW